MLTLTPPLLLATLVITTLATGGLLGLWAATSRWHWFARTMVVLGVLAPLLWRPIYEPFVYRPHGLQFKLYSRWDDHQDDGGELNATSRSSFFDLDGDVSLDAFFALPK
ncbi:hypothetical protein NG895_14155 [Aeoliella sp. ICT_H6.2]|uniref:Uncharacterized protein n=1 Tax=Aeoliella straminimaris TaxID=2954799 RepID=A0A9X2FEZ2_9BACT|nr:hypothetical protein [Aeoliella straminimaris]MCO6045049.1 hypothetical protein [Aeoliella straminimaris]